MNIKLSIKKTTLAASLLMFSFVAMARTEAEADKKTAEVMKKLTLDEKLKLMHGVGIGQGEFGDENASSFGVAGIERLGIPPVYMGHGLTGTRVGRDSKIRATYVSAPIGIGCTWDPALYTKVGVAIAKEMRALGQDLNLGPTLNIIRNPLGGRSWESFSEDPYLTGELIVPFTKAMQAQGIIVGPKHFAANNQEHHRFNINNVLDDRTLREMYLPGFQAAVERGGALNMMGAYNMLNGELCCQNRYLLTDILRNEWNFKGFVLSDFGNGVKATLPAVNAGLNVEMHAKKFYGERLKTEIEKGTVKMEVVDELVREYLKVIYLMDIDTRDNRTKDPVRSKETLALTREVAEGAIVLLKNDGILPLDAAKKQKIAVIGPNAQANIQGIKLGHKWYYMQGGGSGRTFYFDNAVIDPLVGIKQAGKNAQVVYAQGTFGAHTEVLNEKQAAQLKQPANVALKKKLMDEAVATAKSSDLAVMVMGLTGANETEGFDRKVSELPANQQELMAKVTAVNKNVVVFMVSGSYIDMSAWEDKVKAIIYVPYCGEQVGYAMGDILFGNISPSGKLSTTWPKKVSDFHPESIYTEERGWSLSKKANNYTEGIYVGYRWFDKQNLEVSYPFGHGLSYSEFKYSNIKAKKKGNKYIVTVDIKNIGKVDAKEVAQLYINDVKSTLDRPKNELKGFDKVFIKKGQTVTASFTLDSSSFSYYNPEKKAWVAEAGDYVISVGSSSRDLRVKTTITLK